MKKISEWLLIGCTMTVLFAVGLWTVTHSAQTVSYYENRTLAAQPAATSASLGSGGYFDAWERFFIDHAAGRDRMLRLNTKLERSLLRLPVVNELVAADGALLPFVENERVDEGRLSRLAQAMTEGLGSLRELIESYGGQFYYVAVPEQSSYFADRYPAFLFDGQAAVTATRDAFFSALAEQGVEVLDMRAPYAALSAAQPLYFATDHHYTIEGALALYNALTARLVSDGVAVSPLTREQWQFETLPNPFLGSRNRKLYGLYDSDDVLTYAEPVKEIPFTREDNGESIESAVLALPHTADERVTYEVFMGGDVAEAVIRTERPELPSVLLYGDSFTNALESLLYTAFDETRSLDLRHYTGSLRAYIEQYRPDVVVCLRDDQSLLLATGNGATD